MKRLDVEQLPGRFVDYSQRLPLIGDFYIRPSYGLLAPDSMATTMTYGIDTPLFSGDVIPPEDIRFVSNTPSCVSVQNPDDEFIFRLLADTWQRETGHYSIVQQKVLHPAYQEIIGLGERVLPFLIEELDRRATHWFWALRAIARENPAENLQTIEQAVAAWKDWWVKKSENVCQTGYLLIGSGSFRN